MLPLRFMDLEVSHLQFQHPGSPVRLAVKSLEVRAGCPLALVGPSGGGKTTLLRLLSGLLEPQQGEIRLGGESLAAHSADWKRRFRLEHLGLVFQDFALLDYLTAEENILLPSQFLKKRETTAARVRELAEKLEITACLHRRTSLLSQGERQRVAIARALVHEPRVVLADEPTAALDTRRRDLVMALLLDYARSQGAALVVVTHDTATLSLFPEQLAMETLVS